MAKRILIADDSANMRSVIRALLAMDWMRLSKS
jgi:hypothetical protein